MNNEPDIRQVEQHLTAVLKKERRNVFRHIPWSLTDCCIALGMVAIFRVSFHVLSLIGWSDSVYLVGLVIWVLMYGWMTVFPLWIARNKCLLQRSAVGRVLKEFVLAIPLVICLILVEWLFLVILQKVTESPVELGSALSGLRNAPNDPRLYLLLIPMITLGPVAEELFFRGLLYNALRQRIKPLIAVVLQALVFAMMHYGMTYVNITALLLVFATGIILASVYEWRKTLWSPIALHILINFAFAAPVIVLMILNSHTPAKTWQEAEIPPDWLDANLNSIERKATGEEQRLYAIDTWGSRGLRMWKKELQGFKAVCSWFPQDREACAKARIGIATIYRFYLRDLRRAVVESDHILSKFRDQPEVCAQALEIRGWVYYELGDYQKSRKSFQELFDLYISYEWVGEAALEGLKALDSK